KRINVSRRASRGRRHRNSAKAREISDSHRSHNGATVCIQPQTTHREPAILPVVGRLVATTLRTSIEKHPDVVGVFFIIYLLAVLDQRQLHPTPSRVPLPALSFSCGARGRHMIRAVKIEMAPLT